ncbi:MAG TPA: hypothetical protein VEK57_23775 [Thermoanaerobaculia bacterium]|nr:hypothetical protein [Thermoanaerobaculia bacterium]
MADLKLHPAVERVTILHKDPETGRFRPSAVYKNEGRKRTSKRLRPMEKFIRRMGKAQARAAAVYNARHDRSNRKKKNGWLKDLISNMGKAHKQGWKTLRN